MLWQTAPGEQTSPGDPGVQFNAEVADLLRRRIRQEAAAFWAATLITQSPVEILTRTRIGEPLARLSESISYS